MHGTISRSEFHDNFTKSDSYKDNFTYEWLDTLYDLIEEMQTESEDPLSIDGSDIVSICCEWTEKTIDDIRQDCSLVYEEYPKDSDVLEYIKDHSFSARRTEKWTIVYMIY